MRVLHFDCFSGISGDMTLGAFIDAGVDADAVSQALASLNLPIKMHAEKVRKGGFAATQVRVEAPHEHKHRHLHHVEEILNQGKMTDNQRRLAMDIFRRLAQAEATVHGMSAEKVHFHEVGALDSIADIVGAAVAFDLLNVEHVTSSPVPTGSGMVQCAHGMMPIPAPGTAELLMHVPLRPCPIEAELTTPTGAAILTTIANEWIDTPDMTIEQIGHGAGSMEFDRQPNILRVFVGSSTLQAPGEAAEQAASVQAESDTIVVLETNLDDIPGEVIGYCCDRLFAAGALDVFTIPVFMKKNRPGVLLRVLASEETAPEMERILFKETTTFGIRHYSAKRTKLQRRIISVATPFGEVRGKLGWREGEQEIFTPEYDDCQRIAASMNVPLRDVYLEAQLAFQESDE